MLTHGQGQRAYGHFSLGLWPGDPNFTIGSLAMCLRNLERIDNHVLGDLDTTENEGLPYDIFTALTSRISLDNEMKDKFFENYKSNVPIQDQYETRFNKLSDVLLLQLDNCGSENKNRYLFAYLSLLVARGVFQMVQLGFLMVRHTHEDIDALFSRFSEKLRTNCTFTFPHLMQSFNECVSMNPAPFLVKEVPDFKKFMEGYMCDGKDRLIGHSKPLQFRFYM